MTSLEALSKSYSLKKKEVSNLRKQVEAKLIKAVSKMRSSSSRLKFLEKKLEELTRAKDHVLQVLNQHLSQRASIERLKIAAEERLKQEENAKEEAKQQTEYGIPEEKTSAIQRLKDIDEKITELHAELKERESNMTRLAKEIESVEKEKVKIEEQLKKAIHSKPGLVEQNKIGAKEESILRPKFESLQKIEAKVSNSLTIIHRKLAELAAQEKKRKEVIAAQKRKNPEKAKKAKRKPTKRKIVKRKPKSRR
jgi:chromosome segregation ATPase